MDCDVPSTDVCNMTRKSQREQPTSSLIQASTDQNQGRLPPSSNTRVTRSTQKQDMSPRAPVANMRIGQPKSTVKEGGNMDVIASATTQSVDGITLRTTNNQLLPPGGRPRPSRMARQEPIDPTPIPAEQPELAKEFEYLTLPGVPYDRFFGHGGYWNELTKKREELLLVRPELAKHKPTWLQVALDKHQQYPMSAQGKNALKKLVIEPGVLMKHLRSIDQFFKKFEKQQVRAVQRTRADICHLIIPRLIRYIDLLCMENSYFRETFTIRRLYDMGALREVANLFKRLERLSDLVSIVMQDDMPSSRSRKVDEALAIINVNSGRIKTVLLENWNLQNLKLEEMKLRKFENQREEDEKEHKRQQMAKQAENERERRKKTEARRIQQEMALKNEENMASDMLALEQAKRKWWADETIRGFHARKVWDQNYAKMLDERCKSTAQYQKDMHSTSFESRPSNSLPTEEPRTLMKPLKNGRSTPHSTLESGPWTLKLSYVLIKKLADSSHLSGKSLSILRNVQLMTSKEEARYAKCHGCEELQSMSIDAIKRRAREMKPTLEENYRKSNQAIPAWVASIK